MPGGYQNPLSFENQLETFLLVIAIMISTSNFLFVIKTTVVIQNSCRICTSEESGKENVSP